MNFKNVKEVLEISREDWIDVVKESGIYNYFCDVSFNIISGRDVWEQRESMYKEFKNILDKYFTDKSSGYIEYGENFALHGISNNSRRQVFLIEENRKYKLGYINLNVGFYKDISLNFQDNDLEYLNETFKAVTKYEKDGVR